MAIKRRRTSGVGEPCKVLATQTRDFLVRQSKVQPRELLETADVSAMDLLLASLEYVEAAPSKCYFERSTKRRRRNAISLVGLKQTARLSMTMVSEESVTSTGTPLADHMQDLNIKESTRVFSQPRRRRQNQ